MKTIPLTQGKHVVVDEKDFFVEAFMGETPQLVGDKISETIRQLDFTTPSTKEK